MGRKNSQIALMRLEKAYDRTGRENFKQEFDSNGLNENFLVSKIVSIKSIRFLSGFSKNWLKSVKEFYDRTQGRRGKVMVTRVEKMESDCMDS